MTPDWNIILTGVGLGIIMVGGYVKLRLSLAADYKSISDRLLKIETRLEMDDKGADDRRKARRREMTSIARAVYLAESKMTSSSRLQQYHEAGE